MRGRRLSLAVGIAVVGTLIFSAPAHACSCIDRAPREALREADAAIVGRLVRVVPTDSYSAEYHYLVRRAYKRGKGIRAGGTVVVRSGVNGASCGLPLSEKRWYGLFLHRSGGGWSGSSCALVAPRQLAAAAAWPRRGDGLAGANGGGGADCAS